MNDDKVLIISSDCHAGNPASGYNEYMPAKYHDQANEWWVQYTREMMSRVGTFFDQEAVEAYSDDAGEGRRSHGGDVQPERGAERQRICSTC